jgi:carboxyl-terminal processing protease
MVRRSVAIASGVVACLLVGVVAFCTGWVASARAGGLLPGALAAALGISQSALMNSPEDARPEFEVFWDVWQLVGSEFYHTDPLDKQKMVYGAVRGMLESLGDEYTTFQEPDLAAQTREHMQGSFEGIGTYVKVEEGRVKIDRPIKGSPAAKAGLRSDDVIVKVDGQELEPLVRGLEPGEAASKAASLIRGPKGSTVVLTLEREGQQFEVALVRDDVPLISVNYQFVGDTAYIQITEFRARTTEELDAALAELLPRRPTGIVLDLRNNPGGYLETAQEVLGRFYNGVALFERDSRGEFTQLNTIGGGRTEAYSLPMVVLVNSGSASASEIVAGALRDQRPNTFLLGEKSFGKGSVQNIHTLRDGSSARITIAQWLTPNKEQIHKVGLLPEYVVAPSDEARYAVVCVADRQPDAGGICGDAQLFWGLKLVTGAGAPPPATAVPAAQN